MLNALPDSGRLPSPMARALERPSGARYFRCALQVNPFAYLLREAKATTFSDEESYNRAIVAACKDSGIEVIAVTDHQRIKTSESLIRESRAAGIEVFPGFEALTKEGVHVLCLFDPVEPIDRIERYLGDCGVHDEKRASQPCKYDIRELLEQARSWRAACIAAHVAGKSGLLATLKGQAAIEAWRSEYLVAVALPGPIKAAPDNIRQIIENLNSDYKRDRPIAVINASDVNAPIDLADPSSSSLIKMSEITTEGLRQAFLDPESRVRLNSDPVPEEHSEFVAVGWETEGFLKDATLHFNENLNVLIGGRGSGKSTVIESLRFVLGLEPLTEEAKKSHTGIINQVLRSGTKISLLLRSHRPARRDFIIERTVPNPPIVRDEAGTILPLKPQELVPRIEIYGQHELSELARDEHKRTALLNRFVKSNPTLAARKHELRRELERSRLRITEVASESQRIEESLAALPSVEATLKAYEQAGLEDRLKEQSLLVREERVIASVPERLQPFRELLDDLRRQLPIDRAFVSERALDDLPGREILAGLNDILSKLSGRMTEAAQSLETALVEADASFNQLRSRWSERERAVQANYERILRELQKSRIDGEEFISLRRRLEQLRPLRERQTVLERSLDELRAARQKLLVEWEDTKAEEFRELQRAAHHVTRELAGRVRVLPTAAGSRKPLFQVLKKIGGRWSETIESLKKKESLSLTELAGAIRAGREPLVRRFGLIAAQADRLSQAEDDVIMEIEELDLPATTQIELNIGAEGQRENWRTLEDLSTGQKATAILLLLLLESDAPLVVDQPEDDLDNRFITEGIVPKMREEKRRRQFIFATHNANIPVLGDAELIVALAASGEAAQGQVSIEDKYLGSIDARPVREVVEEILEGGPEAFKMRRLKYGF